MRLIYSISLILRQFRQWAADMKDKKQKLPKIEGGFKSVIAALAVAFLLYIFTFYIDGEMGVILIAFMLFAPLTSLFFAIYARKRIRVSFDCDGYVKKDSRLAVKVTVEKLGSFPLGIVEIRPYASEVFSQPKSSYKLSLIRDNKKTFTYHVEAVIGGNGEISLPDIYSCGFLGFVRLRLKSELPPAVSVGVIPEIPQIKATSQLFRNIADVVMTSDEDEDNDTAMLFSANTAPGYEHREYVSGDPLKRVNWKLSSKKDKLMVRLDEAVASVQPMIVLDLYRSSAPLTEQTLKDEEQLIRSVFGLLSLLVRQGIASTFVYYGADGGVVSENVDNPDYPAQLLLKVLAVKVVPERRIDLRRIDSSVCACVVASTDCGADIAALTDAVEEEDNVSLIGVSHESRNLTDLPMWYLDGDNNFKLV